MAEAEGVQNDRLGEQQVDEDVQPTCHGEDQYRPVQQGPRLAGVAALLGFQVALRQVEKDDLQLVEARGQKPEGEQVRRLEMPAGPQRNAGEDGKIDDAVQEQIKMGAITRALAPGAGQHAVGAVDDGRQLGGDAGRHERCRLPLREQRAADDARDGGDPGQLVRRDAGAIHRLDQQRRRPPVQLPVDDADAGEKRRALPFLRGADVEFLRGRRRDHAHPRIFELRR